MALWNVLHQNLNLFDRHMSLGVDITCPFPAGDRWELLCMISVSQQRRRPLRVQHLHSSNFTPVGSDS